MGVVLNEWIEANALDATAISATPPAALVDWNSNYAGDDDKCVLFHCGNWALL